jgi:hypothetical protein
MIGGGYGPAVAGHTNGAPQIPRLPVENCGIDRGERGEVGDPGTLGMTSESGGSALPTQAKRRLEWGTLCIDGCVRSVVILLLAYRRQRVGTRESLE